MVIGLSGKSGSGKDTVAKIILDLCDKKYPHSWSLSFAHNIKHILSCIINRYTIEDIDRLKNSDKYIKDFYINKEPVTMRQALQFIGEEFKKIFGEDIWIKMVRDSILNYNYIIQVITDIRFENEFDFVKKELEGITILITNPNSNEYNHISEKPINRNFDYIIENNSSLRDLKKKVKQILIKENIL